MRKFYIAAAIVASAAVFCTSVVMSSADTPRRSPAYYVAAAESFLPTPALEPAW
jgi:hypothetical protein